ncbi:MAG: response regulator transcription factor [Methylocystis sp.]
MRILIVEDHIDLAREIAKMATRAGLVADLAGSLDEARESVRTNDYDLALIDRRLPDGDGISLIRDLRVARPGLRVMLLTALGATSDKIEGLDAGADDYLTKPFDPDELTARIRACLRRPGGESAAPILLANLSFQPDTKELRVDERPVVLHKRELMLLESLLQRAGRVTLRETLAEEVFGMSDEMNWHTLVALASQLRARLKEIGAKVEIYTARGIGYFVAKSDA